MIARRCGSLLDTWFGTRSGDACDFALAWNSNDEHLALGYRVGSGGARGIGQGKGKVRRMAGGQGRQGRESLPLQIPDWRKASLGLQKGRTLLRLGCDQLREMRLHDHRLPVRPAR